MKKLLLLIVAIMPCLLLYSQEANDDNFVELTVIPRFEANYSSIEEQYKYNLGNSALYALFEGQHNNLSWTISTHFINSESVYEDIAKPYKEIGYSNSINFLHLFLVNYSLGNWTFSLGKDVIRTGGIEYYYWDWEVHSNLATELWNGLACYQWGASVTYAANENHAFTLQAVTSPFGERPFSSKLFAYSAQWYGSFDWGEFLWSASLLENQKGRFLPLYALGQIFYLNEDLSLSIDYNNLYTFSEAIDPIPAGFIKGTSIKSSLMYNIDDKWSLSANYLFSSAHKDSPLEFEKTHRFGVTAQYSPIEDLYIHSLVGYDNTKNFTVNIGARYNIRLIK